MWYGVVVTRIYLFATEMPCRLTKQKGGAEVKAASVTNTIYNQLVTLPDYGTSGEPNPRRLLCNCSLAPSGVHDCIAPDRECRLYCARYSRGV